MITNHKSSFYNKTITRSRRIHAPKQLSSTETFMHFKNEIKALYQGLVVEVVIIKSNINFYQSLRKK